jgi:hypothetical protein
MRLLVIDVPDPPTSKTPDRSELEITLRVITWLVL